jgi:hypothetical protein
VGLNAAGITDLESEIKSLRDYYIKALRSLADEDFAANCIFMHVHIANFYKEKRDYE